MQCAVQENRWANLPFALVAGYVESIMCTRFIVNEVQFMGNDRNKTHTHRLSIVQHKCSSNHRIAAIAATQQQEPHECYPSRALAYTTHRAPHTHMLTRYVVQKYLLCMRYYAPKQPDSLNYNEANGEKKISCDANDSHIRLVSCWDGSSSRFVSNASYVIVCNIYYDGCYTYAAAAAQAV